MTPSIPLGEVRRLGDRAFLIGVADAVASRKLVEELTTALGDDAEVVGGAASVMVHATDAETDLRPLVAMANGVCDEVARRAPSDVSAGPGRLVIVPCRFDGLDLDEVAGLAGCRPAEVAALLTGEPLTVAVVGFSPGFAYLGRLPSPLDRVPRRTLPRPVVPAGSVAIANGQAAVYPTASPGGWHLVGRTGFSLFAPDRPPYAVLSPGDRVQFTVAAEGERLQPEPVVPPTWSLPADARAVFEVLTPGLRAVVQDGGRVGVIAVGVPGAGPADPVSFELANRLAGNAPGAGTLEVTGGGTRLLCVADCHVAVVGAAPEVRAGGSTVEAGRLLPLGPGQTLEVGRQHGGCRSYL
jgi:KipI family sensor histidine kinase inhibitor